MATTSSLPCRLSSRAHPASRRDWPRPGPSTSEEELLDAARATARSMPEDEQIELLGAHPRIGADPSTVSAVSHAEQGYDDEPADDQAWVGAELEALNEAYEERFGFRFVIFVAGRPRSEILPLLEHAVGSDRDEELRRGLDDAVLIAADRMRSLRGPGRASGRAPRGHRARGLAPLRRRARRGRPHPRRPSAHRRGRRVAGAACPLPGRHAIPNR